MDLELGGIPRMQDVDYLIIGAGAVGLAFADLLVQESDATIAIAT